MVSVFYSRSTVGLRADQRATRDAMPRLHTTMSVGLIKDLAAPSRFPPSLSLSLSIQCFRGHKPHVKEFKD